MRDWLYNIIKVFQKTGKRRWKLKGSIVSSSIYPLFAIAGPGYADGGNSDIRRYKVRKGNTFVFSL
jgi:hypothetical protein